LRPENTRQTPADSDIVSPTQKKEIYTTLHKDENVDCVFRKSVVGGESGWGNGGRWEGAEGLVKREGGGAEECNVQPILYKEAPER